MTPERNYTKRLTHKQVREQAYAQARAEAQITIDRLTELAASLRKSRDVESSRTDRLLSEQRKRLQDLTLLGALKLWWNK